MDPILLERRGPVAVLTLNRPKALNALGSPTLEALLGHCATLAGEAALRAVVVTGSGRAFSAGADIEEMRDHGPAEAVAFSRLGHRAMSALEALPVPVVAAVNGYALGGGCELALACDWIYASERARFGLPEVNLALLPGFGATGRLPRRVGPGWAKELTLTGEPIDAQVALRIGLANRVFPVDGLLDGALETAATIARKGPVAVAEAKRVLAAGCDAPLAAAHALEQAAFGVVAASEDRTEGIAAHLEQRDPRFSGR